MNRALEDTNFRQYSKYNLSLFPKRAAITKKAKMA